MLGAMRIAGTLLLALAFATQAGAKELWERQWIEVKTPHFTVMSARAQEETVELAVELENFHRAAVKLTGRNDLAALVPVRVRLFPGAVPELGLERHGSALIPAVRVLCLLLAWPSAWEKSANLSHDYVHAFLRGRDARQYPTWFDEGFAELVTTIRPSSDHFVYGANSRLLTIAGLGKGIPFPMESVLRMRSSPGIAAMPHYVLRAQSWVLVHYLMFGREGHDFGAEMDRYLKLEAEGADAFAAFHQAFGVPAAKLTGTLRDFFPEQITVRKLTLDQPFSLAEARVRSLPPHEVAVSIGDLALWYDNFDFAKRAFDAALAAKPNTARALVGLAEVHKGKKRYAEADALYLQAIALEPNAALHELDYAEFFYERADSSQDPAQRAELLKDARRHFARSHQLDPENPETLMMYGATFLYPGEPAEKGIDTLTAARDLLPSNPLIQFFYARGQAAVGNRAEARRVLALLRSWMHLDQFESPTEMLAQLESEATGPEAPRAPEQAP